MTSASPFDPDFDPARLQAVDPAVPFVGEGDRARIRAAHLLDLGAQLLRRRRVSSPLERRLLGIPALASGPARQGMEQRDFDDAVPLSMRGALSREPGAPDIATVLWEAVDRESSAAPALINVELHSDDDVVSTAAAAAIHVATNGTSVPARTRLEAALQSTEETAREIAAVALRPDIRTPEVMSTPPAPPLDAETSVCIHGTWAGIAADSWYAAGTPLHNHIKTTCTPNLFGGMDHFRWSGGYSEQDRIDAASDFANWKSWQGIGAIDTIFAHSHGGNVALTRLADGERIRQLVLLHTPVTRRPRTQWEQIAANVDSVLVLHTWGDLVMWADRLANRSAMRPSRVLPHRLVPLPPLARRSWFSHDYFLRTENWIAHEVGMRISYEHRLRRRS